MFSLNAGGSQYEGCKFGTGSRRFPVSTWVWDGGGAVLERWLGGASQVVSQERSPLSGSPAVTPVPGQQFSNCPPHCSYEDPEELLFIHIISVVWHLKRNI